METASRKQSGLLEELRANMGRLASMRRVEGVGGAVGVSSDQNIANSFVSVESAEGQEAMAKYMKIVEQIQHELEESELEKALILHEREALQTQTAQQQAELAKNREEIGRLERNLQVYIALVDSKSGEIGRLSAELEKVRSEKQFMERNGGQRLEKLRREFEGKVESLEDLVRQMQQERKALSREKDHFQDSSLTYEEYKVFLQEKIEELGRQLVSVRTENDFMKLLTKGLREEIAEMSQRTDELRKELESTRFKCALEIQETLLACQERLNQATQPLAKSGGDGLGSRKASEFHPLSVEESGLHFSRLPWDDRKASVGIGRAWPASELRETSLFSKLEQRKTTLKGALAALTLSHLDTIAEVQLEPDTSEFSAINPERLFQGTYLDQLTDKDRQIDELRRQLFEAKADRESSAQQRDRNALEMLRLEVRHLEEQIESLKKSHGESMSKNQKFINDIVGDRIHFVQKLQIDLAHKDREVAQLNKKIKQLNFVVDIYKNQALSFNLRRDSTLSKLP